MQSKIDAPTKIKDKILNWLANGETGISSEAMAFKMAGVNQKAWCGGTHPSDGDDFKRCMKLVNEVPEIRTRLEEMCSVSKCWKALIDNWESVEKCYVDHGYCDTTEMMRTIYRKATAE